MAIAIGTQAVNPQTGHTIVMTPTGWAEQGSPQMPMSQVSQDAIKSDVENAQQAAWLAQKADQFRQIQQGQGGGDVTGTGPQYKDVGIPHVAENINPLPAIAMAVNPRMATMDSIANQAWAHMRPTGSGPMRMPEIEAFQEAFPAITHTSQANAAIATRLDQDAQTAAQKLQFLDQYIRSNQGSYGDANAAWEKSQQGNISMNPLPPPQGQNAYGQPAAAQTYNSGVQPTQGQVPPVSMSPAATPMQQQAAQPAQGFQILNVQ